MCNFVIDFYATNIYRTVWPSSPELFNNDRLQACDVNECLCIHNVIIYPPIYTSIHILLLLGRMRSGNDNLTIHSLPPYSFEFTKSYENKF